MIKNAGNLDRILRVFAGLVMMVLAFTGTFGLLGGIGGAALAASGLIGWCAVYRVLGLKTRGTKSEN
jgi:hypothetical protein